MISTPIFYTVSMVEFKDIKKFDTYAYALYKKNKVLDFIAKHQTTFDYRIYTHNETDLCHVYGYYLRNVDHCTPMPSCLRCLAHTLRYSKDKYVQSVILRSIVFLYEEGPNMQSIIARAKHTKSQALYEFGLAIVEVQGIYGVFDTYINTIDSPLAVKIQAHPLLHKMLMEDEYLKRRVYARFRARKQVFYEELYAKAWHPSRFMQWCYTEDEKEGMEIPEYKFQKNALWNIVW